MKCRTGRERERKSEQKWWKCSIFLLLYPYPNFLAGWSPDWVPYPPKALNPFPRLLLIPRLNTCTYEPSPNQTPPLTLLDSPIPFPKWYLLATSSPLRSLPKLVHLIFSISILSLWYHVPGPLFYNSIEMSCSHFHLLLPIFPAKPNTMFSPTHAHLLPITPDSSNAKPLTPLFEEALGLQPV